MLSSQANIWTGRLLAEAQFGHVIIVGGIVKPHPIKLSINFSDTDNAQAPTIHDNIVLHLSVRFNERQIVRSSHFPGVGWSEEQISDNLIGKRLKNPLQPGQPFTIRLSILQAIFQVHINDELYCTYDYHRCGATQPQEKQIKYVSVQHDFERITQFDHRQLFPNVFPVQFDFADWADADHGIQYRYVFGSDVPEALAIGSGITIHGLVAGNKGAEFGLDLLRNECRRIVLRFNIRFETKTVVRNAQRVDCRFYKEEEERVGGFPFKRGQPFKLALQITRESFMIYVNGEFYTYFNHRQPPNHLAILKGWASAETDFTISRIEYNQNHPMANPAKALPCCSLDYSYPK